MKRSKKNNAVVSLSHTQQSMDDEDEDDNDEAESSSVKESFDEGQKTKIDVTSIDR